MEINKLNDRKIRSLNEPGRYADGGNLYLQVSQVRKRITKSWLLRYTWKGDAKSMGLGSCDTFSLAKAREMAAAAREKIWKGIDPLGERQAAKHGGMTFQQCAERYIAAHKSGWADSGKAWEQSLRDYVYPIIGNIAVSQITTEHVLGALRPIWDTKRETASRTRGRIETVLNAAKAIGARNGENPAAWEGHLDHLLAAKAKDQKHLEALPYDQIPAFMDALRAADGIAARALEWSILTATRSGETLGATWSEIDTKNRLWIIPGNRMKKGKEHRVPLSDRCVEILECLPRLDGDERLFPGTGDRSLRTVLVRINKSVTVHGFRSTFRDWAAERTGYQNHIVEMALAHAIGSKVEASYRRGDLLEKRQSLMAAWSKYCLSKPVAGEVLPLRRA